MGDLQCVEYAHLHGCPVTIRAVEAAAQRERDNAASICVDDWRQCRMYVEKALKPNGT